MEEVKPTQITEEGKKIFGEAQMKDRLASEKEAQRSEPKEEESEPTQTKDEKEAKEKFDKLKNISEVLATATLKELNFLSNDKDKVDCLSKSMMSFFAFASLSVLS